MFRAIAGALASIVFLSGLAGCGLSEPPLESASITDEMIAQGEAIFSENSCSKCHRKGGAGGKNGPNLSDGEWLHGDGSPTSIRSVIEDGVSKKEIVDSSYSREMKPKGGLTLSQDEINSLAAYAWSLSQAVE